ncbi:MAG: vWA domain-containing protein [Akkermansiaceae bacterium]
MNQNLSEIVYILDRSGSMEPLQQAAIDGFNEFLKGQLDSPGDANLSLMLFDDEFNKIHDRTPLQKVRALNHKTYSPRGSTALLDASGFSIDTLGKQLAAEPEEKRPGKVIVAIYTDGYENASNHYTLKEIHQRITRQRKEFAWEFLFLAANQDAIATATQMGIDRSMASSVQLNEKGMRDSTASMSRKLKAMRAIHRTLEEEADFTKSMSEIVSEEEAKED